MNVGGMPARALTLKGPETYRLPKWNSAGHAERVKTLRRIAMEYGRDPRVPAKVVDILRASGAQPRHYDQQAQALLKWVQDNIYYVNEPDERLQSPEYTLRVGHGDCDDMAILLASFYESVGLPWRFALSGFDKAGTPYRWVEGTPLPRGVNWAHIYAKVGWPPGRPSQWLSAEPTIKGVKLGWDVVDALQRGEKIPLPEMAKGGALAGVPYGLMPVGLLPVLHPVGQVTPIQQAVSDIRNELEERLSWKKLIVTTIVGSVTTVATGMAAVWIQRTFFGKKRRR